MIQNGWRIDILENRINELERIVEIENVEDETYEHQIIAKISEVSYEQ